MKEEIKDDNGDFNGKFEIKTYYYKHRMINHSDKHHPFKNDNGICTNAIEGMWGDVKRVLKARNGIRKEYLQSHLDEYLFRFNMTDGTPNDVFIKLLNGIAHHWPAKWN